MLNETAGMQQSADPSSPGQSGEQDQGVGSVANLLSLRPSRRRGEAISGQLGAPIEIAASLRSSQ